MTHSTMQLKTLKHALSTVVLALCMATGVAAAKDVTATAPSIMTMRVDGEIAIDAQGNVLDYRIETKLEPAVRAQLDKAIPKWSFFPVQIQGKPTAVKSKMRITMLAREVAAGYAVSVDNVLFSDDRASTSAPSADGTAAQESFISSKSLVPPGYPLGLLRSRVEGAVLVYILVTPDGKVGDVVAAQSSLFNVRGRTKILDEALRILESNTLAAVKKWRFNVPAGHNVSNPNYMSVAVPVSYIMAGSTSDPVGQWRLEVRSELKSATWLPSSRLTQAVGISDLKSGEVMPLISRVRLRDDTL